MNKINIFYLGKKVFIVSGTVVSVQKVLHILSFNHETPRKYMTDEFCHLSEKYSSPNCDPDHKCMIFLLTYKENC